MKVRTDTERLTWLLERILVGSPEMFDAWLSDREEIDKWMDKEEKLPKLDLTKED